MLLATLCNELSYGPLERRRALGEEATAVARRIGDPATLVHVLYTVYVTALNVPSLQEQHLQASHEALELAESLGDPVHLFWAATGRHMTAMQNGDFVNATRCLATEKSLSRRLRQPTMLWITSFHEAADALIAGDLDRAETLATLALQIGDESGQPDAFAFYGAQLIVTRLHQGRLGELIALVSDVVAQNPGLAGFHAALALAHLDDGNDAEATRLLEAAASRGFATLPLDIAWMAAIVNYSLVAIYLHAVKGAEQLAPLLSPYSEQIAYQGVLGQEPVALCLGGLTSVLGRYDDAEQYFARSAELSRRGSMSYAEAHTQFLWGLMLRGTRPAGRFHSRPRETGASTYRRSHKGLREGRATVDGHDRQHDLTRRGLIDAAQVPVLDHRLLPLPHRARRSRPRPARSHDRRRAAVRSSAPRTLAGSASARTRRHRGLLRGERDHSVGTRPDIGRGLALRHTVVPQRPLRSLDMDVDGRAPFVRAVVPLHEVVVDLHIVAEAGEPARVERESGLDRTVACRYPRSVSTNYAARARPSRIERDVGAAGVLPVPRPLGVAVANHDDPMRGSRVAHVRILATSSKTSATTVIMRPTSSLLSAWCEATTGPIGDTVAVRQTAGRLAMFDRREAGMAQDVAAPHHQARDALLLERALHHAAVDAVTQQERIASTRCRHRRWCAAGRRSRCSARTGRRAVASATSGARCSRRASRVARARMPRRSPTARSCSRCGRTGT